MSLMMFDDLNTSQSAEFNIENIILSEPSMELEMKLKKVEAKPSQ